VELLIFYLVKLGEDSAVASLHEKFEESLLLARQTFFSFSEADTALYLGLITSNSLFTEENKELEDNQPI
jgi:hypothetical protein